MTPIENLHDWLGATIRNAVRKETFPQKFLRAMDRAVTHFYADRLVEFADVNAIATPRFTSDYTLDVAQAGLMDASGTPSVRCEVQFALVARKGNGMFTVNCFEKSCRIYLTHPQSIVEEDAHHHVDGIFGDKQILARLDHLSNVFRTQAAHEEKWHDDLKDHLSVRAAKEIVHHKKVPFYMIRNWME